MILELTVFLSNYVDREDWKKLKGKRCVWKATTKGRRDNWGVPSNDRQFESVRIGRIEKEEGSKGFLRLET